MADWVTVARADELAPGQWRVAEVEDARIVVFNIDGELYAIEDVCTHDGGRLTGGEIEGDEIVCPRHGARFNVRTGAATQMPAVMPVQTYPVKIEGDQVLVGDTPNG